jgi:hypothetical protein
MTVVVDEVGDRAFQITGQKVVFKQQFFFSTRDVSARSCPALVPAMSGYAG